MGEDIFRVLCKWNNSIKLLSKSQFCCRIHGASSKIKLMIKHIWILHIHQNLFRDGTFRKKWNSNPIIQWEPPRWMMGLAAVKWQEVEQPYYLHADLVVFLCTLGSAKYNCICEDSCNSQGCIGKWVQTQAASVGTCCPMHPYASQGMLMTCNGVGGQFLKQSGNSMIRGLLYLLLCDGS